MSDGQRRKASLPTRIGRQVLGSASQGKLPRLKTRARAALNHPLIATIVGGLVVAVIVSAASFLF